MNIVRTILICGLVLAGWSTSSFALGEEFIETAPYSGPENQTALISQLKQQAVTNRLREMAGDEIFKQLEKQVTRDFADQYVMDYKSRRVGADRNQFEVSGHLDLDGLKKWLRLLEAKRGASSSNVFILSSTVAGLTFSPAQTVQRVRDNAAAQAIFSSVSSSFGRVNQKVILTDTAAITALAPPKVEDTSVLASVTGQNGAIWIHLTPCKSCGGMRADAHYYHPNQGKLIFVRSEDIAATSADLLIVAKAKEKLSGLTQGLISELEEYLSRGGLSGQSIAIKVEGVASYQGFVALREQLEKLDYVNQATSVAFETKRATFETVTPLDANTLAERLQNEKFSGFRLKTQSVDSRNISVRYLP